MLCVDKLQRTGNALKISLWQLFAAGKMLPGPCQWWFWPHFSEMATRAKDPARDGNFQLRVSIILLDVRSRMPFAFL